MRRLALQLPQVVEGDDRFGFSVGTKGIAWVWMERSAPKAPRVPNPSVLAVRVAGESGKQDLLAADPNKFFTEPHYNGFPAILVHLDAVDETELRELLLDAWRIQAPKSLVKQYPDL